MTASQIQKLLTNSYTGRGDAVMSLPTTDSEVTARSLVIVGRKNRVPSILKLASMSQGERVLDLHG